MEAEVKMSKVLLINGSPNENGCTATALKEMIPVFDANGIDTELINIGKDTIKGCIACGVCKKTGKCVLDNDIVNTVADKFYFSDALVVGSPVYYASPNASVLALMDRLMFSTSYSKNMKVGASVVSARRGGTTAAFDVLNKYFSINGMPIATSTYWNQVHGFTSQDVLKDKEGLQTMRNLALNMSFLIKAICDAKIKYGEPFVETSFHTNFADGK